MISKVARGGDDSEEYYDERDSQCGKVSTFNLEKYKDNNVES